MPIDQFGNFVPAQPRVAQQNPQQPQMQQPSQQVRQVNFNPPNQLGSNPPAFNMQRNASQQMQQSQMNSNPIRSVNQSYGIRNANDAQGPAPIRNANEAPRIAQSTDPRVASTQQTYQAPQMQARPQTQYAPQQPQPFQMSNFGPPKQQMYYPNPQGQQFQQPMIQQKSVEQQVNNNDPQSVQNFMTALKQVGAGGNNNMMQAQGQLGAPAQAGFQGFQTNGQGYGPQFIDQYNTGPMAANLGYANQMSTQNQNYNAMNMASSQGQYGVNNQAMSSGNYQLGNQAAQGQYGYAPQALVQNGQMQYGAQNLNPTNLQPGHSNKDAPPWDPNASAEANYKNAFGGGVAASDERVKTNIENAEFELEDFMNKLGVYSYEYKDKAHGEGRYISPMAQEFEASKLGKDAVFEDEHGTKMVNYGRLIGVQTAALALLNKKHQDLEAKFEQAIKNNLTTKKSKKA